jgi:hypothetical protein
MTQPHTPDYIPPGPCLAAKDPTDQMSPPCGVLSEAVTSGELYDLLYDRERVIWACSRHGGKDASE